MCRDSEIVSFLKGEEVANGIIDKKLSIKDLANRGLDLRTLTSTPN
ncbi:MAG: hypothetical protein H7196_02895 [candidate division SR1 bacterium]|nr:hypothetical protein [candidate division SR1 bacterium]